MPKIYTKTGDKGETSLLGGKRVRKCCLEMEAIGEVDELNSLLGMLVEEIIEDFLREAKRLLDIQRQLFVVGAHLAGAQMSKSSRPLTNLPTYKLTHLKKWIDAMEKDLPRLKNFIIPGGCEEAALCFYIRAVCRRAERRVVGLSEKYAVDPIIKQYLNRLSDLLFVLGRWINKKMGKKNPSPCRRGGGIFYITLLSPETCILTPRDK
ncbi:MAG: cob(I)yrinic acid a,c-diamide adenosyltransferase [Candidatus Magasanikbacteria bacterium]|nr:cob(I)yrinic acid a,c-diamide adenosyltransferase [Candidatus Magasanikbacteria bacterium]